MEEDPTRSFHGHVFEKRTDICGGDGEPDVLRRVDHAAEIVPRGVLGLVHEGGLDPQELDLTLVVSRTGP
jgi:hypothetical protein